MNGAPPAGPVVTDAESYYAVLYSPPDFGCVLGEKR
jgi:hypothetical protein